MNEEFDKQDFLDLCVRYLVGEADESDRSRLVAELNDPNKRKRFESLRGTWDSVPKTPRGHYDADNALSLLKSGLAEGHSVRTVRKEGRRGSQNKKRAAFIVAMAAAACIAATMGLRTNQHDIRWVERPVDKGILSSVALTDGTKVIVNADSVLWVPADASQRRARLKGEAFFDVAHRPDKPFVVETDVMELTVLGTMFDVDCYPGDGTVTVSLVEGRLSVAYDDAQGKRQECTLEPGQRLTYDRMTGDSSIDRFNKDLVTAWTTNGVAFENDSMKAVAEKLERRFGFPVELESDGGPTRTLSGRFENESLEEMLMAISFVNGIDYRIIRRDGQIEKVLLNTSGK